MSNCTDCQHIDGGGVIKVTVPQSPFCQDCGDDNNCLEKVDAKCVVYHLTSPSSISLLQNLGMPNGSTVEKILEAIDDLLGSQFNIPLTVSDTSSINLTASGAAGHTLKADLTISTDSGNLLEVRSNGVYVSSSQSGKVKVDETDAPDFLINQIIGGTDGIISNTVMLDSGMVKVEPLLDIECLINALVTNQIFIDAICQIAQNCMGKCPTIGSVQTQVVN